MTLEESFNAMTDRVKTGSLTAKPTQTQKLQLYAWFKQATQGDAPPETPTTGFDLIAKAKFAAWQRVKGLSKEEAMRQYIRFFEPTFQG